MEGNHAKTIPLSVATKFIVDNRGRTAPTVEAGIPLIATNCIDNDHLYPTYRNVRYVSKETYDYWFRSHLEAGDIILTLKGSQNGAVCLVPDPVKFVIAQDMVGLRADENVIDPLFLLAALRSDDVQSAIKNLDVSGVIPHFKKSDFDKLHLPYPDKTTQEAIGCIYFSLSKKIDLLHRQNKTLEALAETLFRQWFVESPEDSWRATGLDAIAEFMNGLPCQKYPVSSGEVGLPVIKIKEIRSGITDSSDRATEDVPTKYLVEDGDVLFSWSGSLEVLLWAGGRGVLNQHLFKVTSEKFPQWFYYMWIKHHLAEFRMIAVDKATTMGHIQRHHLSDATVLVPESSAIGKMGEIVSPLFEKLKKNLLQIKSLTRFRDTLLPKLMSGELHVKEGM
jgi:type I restriction enzyme S subunit